jgi:hypothetical protein
MSDANFNIDDVIGNLTNPYDETTAAQGDGIPRIQWRNGEARMRAPGYAYIASKSCEYYKISPPSEGWQEVEQVFASGATEQGYMSPVVKVIVLGIRECDIVETKVDGRVINTEYLAKPADRNNRPEGWSHMAELLCLMTGFGKQVVNLRTKRVSSSYALSNAVRQIQQGFLNDVRQAFKNPVIPMWSFWLLMRSERDPNGKPVHRPTRGGIAVTPPGLYVPQGDIKEVARKAFIGQDMLKVVTEYRKQYHDWLNSNPGNSLPVDQPVAAKKSDDEFYF